ncbi:MAG: hypothetical protein BZY75_02900 [SAR202 cluster bacterium Io17-Chloro-G7]|nr:MAG: hypothetical protein BZY75_02900 [SAR202 cluster bacterium Io17-Chloro-G7]
MILKTVQIKNYKSINDSTEFSVDAKVTCLVGKNESGKTAILRSIGKLNSTDPSASEFNIFDYPRRFMMEYQQRANDEPAEALTTTWNLSPDDVAYLEPVIGPAARQVQMIKIQKGYDNKTVLTFALNETSIVQHLISSFDLDQEEFQAVQGVESLAELHRLLSDMEPRSDRLHELFAAVVSNFRTNNAHETVAHMLLHRLPKFAYFSEYLRMPGQIAVNDLRARAQANNLDEGDRVFLALLETVGRSVDDLERVDQHEMLTAELEAASHRITQEVFQYWSQNQSLRVQFQLQHAFPGDPAPFNEGWIIRIRIQNTRHGDTINFDERSTGFIWFFSFVIWFNHIRGNLGDNLILLLDDPGLSLHANAQTDLVRYFEERLAPSYQVIYTTHSPFMIDPSKLYRVRTVENVLTPMAEGELPGYERDQGTTVGDQELSSNPETLQPLQAALAYEVSRSFTIAEHTVLVEGPTEVLYFHWFKRRLESLGRTTLDERWVVTPGGGIDKVGAFLTLFAGKDLRLAVVTGANGITGSDPDVRNSELLRQSRVLTLDKYTGDRSVGNADADIADADIEDVIGRRNYLDLMRLAYNLQHDDIRTLELSGNPSAKVVEEVKNFMTSLPEGPGRFDRYRAAAFLIQQGPDFSLPDMDQALSGFEALFQDLNAMLN